MYRYRTIYTEITVSVCLYEKTSNDLIKVSSVRMMAVDERLALRAQILEFVETSRWRVTHPNNNMIVWQQKCNSNPCVENYDAIGSHPGFQQMVFGNCDRCDGRQLRLFLPLCM